MCYSVTLCQKVKKNCQKVGQERKKSCQKIIKNCQKIVKNCQKVGKKLAKSVKKLSKLSINWQKVGKKLSKSWQKVGKKLPKLPKLSRIGCESKMDDHVLFLNKVWGGWEGKKWFQGYRRLLCSQPKAKIELVKYSTKKSKISHYPNNFLRGSPIEP
jgi:hypothetical protein